MSLSNKLSLYILLLVVAIFGIIGMVVERYNNKRAEEQVLLYTDALVDNIAADLEGRIMESERQVAEYVPALESNLNDTVAINRTLLQVISGDTLIVGGSVTYMPGFLGQERDSLYMEYVARQSDGRYAEWRVDATRYDYPSMGWFRDPVANGRPMWAEPYFDRGAGDIFMTTFTRPLRNAEGRICAVITVDLSIQDLFAKMEEAKPVADSRTMIVTASGTLIGRQDSVFLVNADVLPKALSTADRKAFNHIIGNGLSNGRRHEEFDHDGTKMIVVSAPVAGTDWAVCCVYKYDEVLAIFGNLPWLAVVILMCGMVALIVLIRAMIVYNMRPLRLLTETANIISEGNLDIHLDEMKTKDEIGRLNNAFLKMKRSLKEQMRRLEITTRDKQRIDSEIRIAHDIQLSLLPTEFTVADDDSHGLGIHAQLQPAREVGGDLYDFFIRDDKLFFVVGDVSGKGVPASLFMGMAITVFRIAARQNDDPAKIVATVNTALSYDNSTNTFVTMFVGVLHLDSWTLHFCNAGHNPPVVSDGSRVYFLPINHQNIPVGLFADFTFDGETMQLSPDMKLTVYTDGVNEAENMQKTLFGDDRLLEAISGATEMTARQTVESVAHSVAEFAAGADQSDDITILCIRRADGSADHVLRMKNSLAEVERLPKWIETVCQQYEVREDMTMTLNLALEEALVNVINYAYAPGVTGEISLRADRVGEAIVFTLIDSGVAFDPTGVAEVDTDAPLDERAIGGLGVHLYRTIMDRVEYERRDGYNLLRLTKFLQGAVPGPITAD